MRGPIMALSCAGVMCLSAAGSAGEEAGPLKDAGARIEQHRMGDIRLALLDGRGRPLGDRVVEVELVRHDFLFGSNIFQWTASDGHFHRRYRTRFEELLNYATLPFYWWAYEPEAGKTDEDRVRKIAAWCAERGITVKGHPLIWNHMDPAWLPDDEAEVRQLVFGRVGNIVRGFAGTVDIWDVLNEPTDWARNAKKAPKTTAAVTNMGTVEACKEALRPARTANPEATLLINDYVTGEAYYKVLDQLRDEEGTLLLDAVGIQTHMHRGPRPLDEMWAVCERFARLGVPLHFTETTVLSEYPDTKLGEEETAQYVADLYTLWFSHPAVDAITWWDFSDRGAWLGAKAGLLREDGTPKPVYERLRTLIHETWTTKETLKSNDRGVVEWHGFYGTYTVRVSRGPDWWFTKEVTARRRDPKTHTQRVLMR